MNIRLLVLRTADMQQLADFYRLLGGAFEYHQHGNSPMHYSATIGGCILEIYPLAKGQTEPDKNLRLGFGIDDFDNRILTLKEMNVPFIAEPAENEFGFMAIVADSDGRKIELYKR